MLASAQDDLARLRAAGLAVPAVSVSVSTRRLFQRGLLDEAELARFAPGTLNFELLESTFLDDPDEMLMWVLDALRERGVGIEIDDFGTGHASITGLLRVQPDRLKIDRALVIPATEHVTGRRMLELIVDMGRTLAIDVIAEGIESAANAELAHALGIPVLQGYHYAPPLGAAEIQARYVRARSRSRRPGEGRPAPRSRAAGRSCPCVSHGGAAGARAVPLSGRRGRPDGAHDVAPYSKAEAGMNFSSTQAPSRAALIA